MSVPVRQARKMLLVRHPVIAEPASPLPHCSTIHEHAHRQIRWRPLVRATLLVIIIGGTVVDVAGAIYERVQHVALNHRLSAVESSQD